MFSENFKMALASIRSARFRSFLTMLGVIIGVSGVITIVSLGEGVKHQISGQTRNVGSDLVTIRPGKLVKRDAENKIVGFNFLSFLTASTITEKDLQTVKANPAVETVVPFSIINGQPSIGDRKLDEGFVMATSDMMPNVIGQKIEYGNFFKEGIKDRKVAIIGSGVAEKLFQENVPIGKSMQIRGQDFVVSGVFERFDGNPLSPEADFNNGVFIPFEAGKLVTGSDLTMYEMLVRPKDKNPAAINSTISGLTEGLKTNHAGEEDFTVLRQDEMVSVADNLLKTITNTVTIMAVVALVVGGIGIMNVMLVAVTERTREIGVRKAVGATNHQIQSQFLIEAVVMSVWGACIGIFISGIINLLFRIFTNFEPVMTWQIVVASALAATAVGIVFGFIPALQASRKDPIEALRTY